MSYELKKLSLFFLTAFVVANTFSQPEIGERITIGGNSYDNFSAMHITNDEGILAGGFSWSDKSGEKTENSRGWYDYWIIKLDSAGKIQWDKTIGGNDDDYLKSLQQTSDGGYMLGGRSISGISGEKTEKGRGGYDNWIIKLNNNGIIEWDKTIGGNDYDGVQTLRQTKDSGYILGGTSWSDSSGEKTENSRGEYDYWIIKLDGAGNIQWDRTFGGSSFDDFSILEQTSDSGYILGGSSSSDISGEKSANSRGKNDYWIIKLDNNGNIQWDKTIGGNSDDYLRDLQQTSDGGYMLGGYSDSRKTSEKSENGRGLNDYWIVKLDSNGNIQWDKTIGGSSDDQLYSLQQIRKSGFILGGHSSSNISGEKTENNKGETDYWIVRIDAAGNIEWDKTIGGSSFDLCYGILEIKKNRYVMGGTSWSNISGDKKRNSRGEQDYWIVRLSDRPVIQSAVVTTETSNIASAKKSNQHTLTFYPNPANNVLYIQTSEKASISIVNLAGKVLLTKTISGKGEINIAHLPTGLYYLKNNTTGVGRVMMVSK